jgi:wobble nucleotide-excising tRNase
MKTIRREDLKFELGDSQTCPKCGKKYICDTHRYAYEKWFKSYFESMTGITIV